MSSTVSEVLRSNAIGAQNVSETGSGVDRLQRGLRALTCVGIFKEDEQGSFGHTTLSETLRRDHPQSTRAWAVLLGMPWIWRPWGELLETVRTGEPGFERIFGDFYRYMSEHLDADVDTRLGRRLDQPELLVAPKARYAKGLDFRDAKQTTPADS